ncbi:MAG: hypothetical protein ACE145_18640 [Terriglobia bacterium]
MRVDLHQEIDRGDETLEIPWFDPDNPQRRYLDLKAQHGLAAEIEECHERPALANFLRQINSSSSAFRTAKCDVWETTDLTEDERRDFGLPYKVGSYVDLLFDSTASASRVEAHLELGAHLERQLAALRVPAELEIALRRCHFVDGDRWVYYLTLFLHGYGSSHEGALAGWGRALEALGSALKNFSPQG